MPLMDDISAAQKEFESAIKEAESRKKEIDKLDADWAKANGDLSKEVQRVMTALKEAKDALKDWSMGYDNWIDGLKEYNKDFAGYKKKSVEVEKFYNDLKDEKDERDKLRKKLGAGSKPTKEQEIADAVFKKAKAAYDNDPGKGIEAMLKDVAEMAKSMESAHKFLVADLNKATKEYDEMCKSLRGFADATAVREWNKSYAVEKNPMGADFDKYFKALK